jgi:glycerate 2-kinase
MGMRAVVAADKFKGSLSAAEVAARVAAGLIRGGFAGEVELLPVADGGDGTVAAALAAGFRPVELDVDGPAGGTVRAAFALRGDVAVIEAAQACGLTRLPPAALAPLTATSRGVGQLILAARQAGARQVVLGVGGVATTDGGAGLVQALGARLISDSGDELPPGGGVLHRLAALDLTGLADLSGIEFTLASDVDNPLLGATGAAAVYGPQKGASAAQVQLLEAGLRRWADIAEGGPGAGTRDAPGAGAAGGIGFAALLFLGARMRPGIELLLELASFGPRLDGAQLVITGEGSLDRQTLHGKAPVGVARAATAHDPAVPVVAVAGRCLLTADELRRAGIARAYALTDIEPDVERCLAEAGPLLELLAVQIAADWLLPVTGWHQRPTMSSASTVALSPA